MAYSDDLLTSESIRHSDKRATPTAAGHLAADQAHYTRLLTAECKWGVSNGAIAALRALGKGSGEIAVPANTSGVAGFNPT